MHGCENFTTHDGRSLKNLVMTWYAGIFHNRSLTAVKKLAGAILNGCRRHKLDDGRIGIDAAMSPQPYHRQDGELRADLRQGTLGGVAEVPTRPTGSKIPLVLTHGRAVSEGRPEGPAAIFGSPGGKDAPLIVTGPGGDFQKPINVCPYFTKWEKITATIVAAAVLVPIGISQGRATVARRTHNPEVAGSTPAPAIASPPGAGIFPVLLAPSQASQTETDGPGNGGCSPPPAARCLSPRPARAGIRIWMNYWAPRVGASTQEELYELYRRGPSGYRQWESQK